jgi:hypothetical protein
MARDHEQPANAREGRDDFLHNAMGEVFLFGIAAHVLKWQNSK